MRSTVAAAVALVVLVGGGGCRSTDPQNVDTYGRSLTSRCAPARAGSTSCSGFAIGPTPDGMYAPGDIIDGQTGYGADELQSAYDIPTALPTTQEIAILAGGANPSLETDLAVYRAQYGLPACTVASGCLRITDATGGSAFAAPRYEDIAESSLEVQVASAACPNCKLIVVVAVDDPTRTPTLPEIAAAYTEAAHLGATAMVTSYGAAELDEAGEPWALGDEALFTATPQFPLFAAAGDGGYLDGSSPDQGVRVPAAYPEVVAVGGTTLSPVSADVSARRWVEQPLPTASSGCSQTFAKPSWQTDTGCAHRTVSDLAAAADGALVYFTTVDPAGGDAPGWHTEGGTGESAALAAGIFAASGRAYNGGPEFSYMNPGYFNDVVGGSNGSCTGASEYLCNGQTGYDGPTGNGSPNGAVFQGTWLTIDADSYTAAAGSSTGGRISTLGYWAQSCPLSFHAVGLPPGVSAIFDDEVYFFGNPFFLFAFHVPLGTPSSVSNRVTIVARCGDAEHTISLFLDIGPCTPVTSCNGANDVQYLCSAAASDSCGGILECPDACSSTYSCIDGICTAPPAPPGPGDH